MRCTLMLIFKTRCEPLADDVVPETLHRFNDADSNEYTWFADEAETKRLSWEVGETRNAIVKSRGCDKTRDIERHIVDDVTVEE